MALFFLSQNFILIFLIKNILSTFIYFDCKINCANDYPDYIISSEGIIQPKNPYPISHRYRDYHYVYNFEKVKHNLEKPICVQLVNLRGAGGLAFDYISINEYIITDINFEDYCYCDNCNINVAKKFETTTTNCISTPFISTSNVGNQFITVNNTFCFNPINDITSLYINDNKINNKYYKGKTVVHIFNNETNVFNINNIFYINGKENLEFFPDTVSFKITSIQNKKGKIIINEKKELSENSFFNYQNNNNLTHIKLTDEGYLMIINIITILRNRESVPIKTCEEDAKIYLYVSQKNCSINETSNNYCQNCKEEYGKYKNNCYHQSEKFTNLYYDNLLQTFKTCETDNKIFSCSICPEGTYIKELNSDFYICEKCPKGTTTNITNQNNCIKCIEHCNSCLPNNTCIECNNNALNGLTSCTKCEDELKWEYNGERCKPRRCSKYFYRDNDNNIFCIKEIIECPDDMIYLNLITGECQKNVSNSEIIRGKYQINLSSEKLEKKSEEIMKDIVNDTELLNYIEKNDIKMYGIDSEIQMGKLLQIIKTDSKTIDIGECPEILRLNLSIKEPEKFLYKIIDFKTVRNSKTNELNYKFYRTSDLDNPINDSICQNQNIKYVSPLEDYFKYFENSKNKELFINFLKQGVNIFNTYSPLYNDYCYPLSTLNKVDLTLNERRNELLKIDLFPCKTGCDFEGVNLEKFEVLCYCKIADAQESDTFSEKLKKGFKNLKRFNNFETLKCPNLVFKSDEIKSNYFSEILLLIFIINIILIIITEKNIKNYFKDLICYSCHNIKDNDDNNIINIKKNIFELILKDYFKSLYLYFIENNDFIDTFFNFDNSYNFQEFKIYSIKIIIYLNSVILFLIFDVFFLNDDAMHRIYEDDGEYNLLYRLPILFFSDFISWIICVLLEILITNKNQLDKIQKDIKNEKIKINIKDNDFLINKNSLIIIFREFNYKFKIKRIFFYIITLLLNIFSWYYISCFFSVFYNTQKHLLIDFGINFLMNVIILLIKGIFYCFLKLLSQKLTFLEIVLKILDNKIVIFIFEVLFEIIIIYISQKSSTFQNIFN